MIWLLLFIFTTTLLKTVTSVTASDRTPDGYENSDVNSYFTDEDMAKLQPALKEFAEYPNSMMWAPENDNISIHHPFIFFHQRKSGGTDLRVSLLGYAHHQKLPHRIPCYDQIHCDTYDIPFNKPLAIYAGHFQWGEQHQLSRFNGNQLELDYSCITNFREPVARILSCIYFRFEKRMHRMHARCIPNIPLSKFFELLVMDTDRYGNSCLNEPFRMLSGLTDEHMLNELGNTYYDKKRDLDTFDASELQTRISTMAMAIFEVTLQHLKKCAPKFLDDPRKSESDFLLKKKFPDMYAKGAFRDVGNQMPSRSYSSDCGRPSDAQLEIVEKLAAYEKLLYDAVSRKVHAAYQEFN